MRAIYHLQIKKDLRAALAYYDLEGGSKLGDRFLDEVESTVRQATQNPQGFHFADDELRRAPLNSFPYHFLFEEADGYIHFLVLRHDKRHPSHGLRRRRAKWG